MFWLIPLLTELHFEGESHAKNVTRRWRLNSKLTNASVGWFARDHQLA
jgi:hypothetical protein